MSNMSNFKLVELPYKRHENWKLKGQESYLQYIQEHLVDGENDLDILIKYIEANPNRNAFRWPIEINTVQFLAAIYPEEKKIRIASKNLSHELFLIQSLAQEIPADLKEHADQIACLDINESPMNIEFISTQYGLPLFTEEKYKKVHDREYELEAKLKTKVDEYRQSFFERVTDFGLGLTANFMLIRVHVLKFLAILPNLDHDEKGLEVKRIFLEAIRRLVSDSSLAKRKKLTGQKRALPYLYIQLAKLVYATANILPAGMLSSIIRFKVSVLAKRFIAGKDITDAKASLIDLKESTRDATVDQLGELVVSKHEADDYLHKVLQIIHGLHQSYAKGSRNSAGINRAHISIKVSALCHNFVPQDFDYTYAEVKERLVKILLAAKEEQVFINIDAEHYHYRDIIFRIYAKVLLETPELKDYADTGIVVQAYLRDGIAHLQEVIELAKKRDLCMPIRLVKGAYWDAETIEADAHNFRAPQFLNKSETDVHFRQLIEVSLQNAKHIQLAVASHNISDHCFAEALREECYPAAPVIEHQCLHMTYEALSVGLSKMNWPTRNYIPVGNLLVGMAYLVRRIMENSSQVGVLTIMRSHKLKMRQKNPAQKLVELKSKRQIVYDKDLALLSSAFKNIYPIRTYFAPHLNATQKRLKEDFKTLQAQQKLMNHGENNICSSSHPELTVGSYQLNTVDEVAEKVELLFKGYDTGTWNRNVNAIRQKSFLTLADLLLFNREELTSLIMFEAGKTLDEATADVDEAIDFIHFYIREQDQLEKQDFYTSRGVVGVIAPWNFPLAIPCGMTMAALASGNSVILKPAEQTPLIAHRFTELCYEAGIPRDCFQVVYGEAEVGKAIVDHELVNGVVFTGSKQVGENIYKKVSGAAVSTQYKSAKQQKFAITEMGGKNAIIVTNNSELDETVSGIIYSAFAHAGQKCSAASRIIIDSQIKDAFLKRFKKAVEDLNVGPSTKLSTMVNPLITKEDQQRVRDMAQKACAEAKEFNGVVHVARHTEDYDAFCVGPTVVELSKEIVLNNETMASQEVFGPLVHVIAYDTLDEAVKIFNGTEYALTGGIYCQSQDDIDYLTPKLEAGNIYINRPNTGARVAIEPFGGFKMSGTGPKAGGVDYLKTFMCVKNTDAPLMLSTEISVSDTINNAQNSKLALERRIKITLEFINKVEERFENVFSGIQEEKKQTLLIFKKQLQSETFHLNEREFPNRYIPGQISFCKKNMGIGNGVIIDRNMSIDINLLSHIMVNFILGNGISLISLNEKIYQKWDDIFKLYYEAGASSFSLGNGRLEKVKLASILKVLDFYFVLFSDLDLSIEYGEIVTNRDFADRLVKNLKVQDFKLSDELISTYGHSRAFAINTMRHGAPLELTL